MYLCYFETKFANELDDFGLLPVLAALWPFNADFATATPDGFGRAREGGPEFAINAPLFLEPFVRLWTLFRVDVDIVPTTSNTWDGGPKQRGRGILARLYGDALALAGSTIDSFGNPGNTASAIGEILELSKS